MHNKENGPVMIDLEAPLLNVSGQISPTHIVGIGASAGGLNALEQFFDNMHPDSGMAFVVIQHLSPDFKSLMDDLLSRHTVMPIHRVTTGVELEANHIYLIPPKTQMTIKEERLYLTEKIVSQHLELPIDIFFHSLAADVGERAIGIILSGTGSDGSRGVVSIHKQGGMVIIQSPESAQFDGMPRNAIATGLSDFILAPDRIPRILREYSINPLAVRNKMHDHLEVFEDEGEFAQIFALLRRTYSLDFSKYKGSTVGRRIQRRMKFRQIPQVSDYAAILSGDNDELELLYKDLLIGVTEFFRDRQSFEFLEQEVLPRLFSNLNKGEDLRVWSAACATGEEAYSLAILLLEQADRCSFSGKITVFATDVHKSSLDFASQGLYDRERLTNVNPERMERFFKKEGQNLYRVTTELRKIVVFAPHNLLNDPPFTRLDLVCCRNLLIYFQPGVQEKVISLFHFALKKEAILFLGSSEGLGSFSGEFEVIASQHKQFRKIRDLKLTIDLDSLQRRADRRPVPAVLPNFSTQTISLDRQIMADYDTLLRRHLPPGVLIDENRTILHYFGNVAEYLRPPEGRAESDILRLAEDNLHIALTTALQRTGSTRQTVTTRNVRVHRGSAEFLIDLTIDPLPDEKSRSTHYHIYFERVRPTESSLPPVEESDTPEHTSFDINAHYRQHITNLEMELQSTRENLQTTVEELQTSNEELQATNEEMLAANEELQSTNEELHSVNEELYSVNSEFERKNLELKQLNTDHDNLLTSTDTGTIFLDRQLRIRKFNPAITSFFKLIPQDIGRPIDHIAYHLSRQEEMLTDIRKVLLTGEPQEKEESTRDGQFLLNRIMPFRTETGQVEGVVITFTDITKIKEADQKISQLNQQLQQIVAELKIEIAERLNTEDALRTQEIFVRATIDAMNDHICVLDETGQIIVTNRAWKQFAEANKALSGSFDKGINYLEVCDKAGEEGVTEARDFAAGTRNVMSGKQARFTMEYSCHSADEQRWFLSEVSSFSIDEICYVVVIHKNVTTLKNVELQVALSRDYYLNILRNAPALIWRAGTDGACNWVNDTWREFTGHHSDGESADVWSKLIHPEDLSGWEQSYCEAFVRNDSFEFVYRMRRHDEIYRWILSIARPFPDLNGNFAGYLGFCFDITERKRNEALLQEQTTLLQAEVNTRRQTQELLIDNQNKLSAMNLELENRVISEVKKSRQKDQILIQNEKLASIGQLAAGVAHEINNPMSFIAGNLSVLEKYFSNLSRFDRFQQEKCRNVLPSPIQDSLADFRKAQDIDYILEDGVDTIKEMLSGAERITRIVDSLKSYSRVDRDEFEYATVSKCLDCVLSNCEANLAGFATITKEYSDVPEIYCHHGNIHQVFMNLLLNAAQSLPDEGKILIKCWADDGFIYVSIGDNGRGIPAEIRGRIFEPFFTTKDVGEGTGLGLSIAHEIVKKHDGFIRVESEVGKGSTFTVVLPRTDPPPP